MSGVRPFLEDDIPQVADLLWKYLHGRAGSSNPGLQTYLKELFLQNPWREEGITSRVYEDGQGKIAAFFGIVPRRMKIQGNPVRLAFGSNFVVEPNSRTSMAAIQLVRAFMKGPQDISITDSATEGSRQLLRSLGFSVVPLYSLHWARPLRVSLFGLHALAQLKKSRAISWIQAVSKPFCATADGLLATLPLTPFRQSRPATTATELDTATLLKCLATIPKNLLAPEYDAQSLSWTLDFVSKRKALGDVRRVLVRDANQKRIGWFIYYAIPGGVGNVLQLGATSSSITAVIEHLLYDAWQHKLIGLEGRLEPQFMEELSRKACPFFRSRSWTLLHSTRADLVGLIQSGNAFFSRLDGEWCLRPGIELAVTP